MLAQLGRLQPARSFSHVNITLNGVHMDGDDDDTILSFCAKNKIQIPSKCNGHESCMLCNVMVDGKKALACTTHLDKDMVIETTTPELQKELLDSIDKIPEQTDLIKNAKELFIDHTKKSAFVDDSTHSVQIDYNKCVDCGECVDACEHHSLLLNPHLQATGNFGLQGAGCTSCGQCIASCPKGAITLTDNVPLYKEAMKGEGSKIAVLDSAIRFNLEKKLGLKQDSLKIEDVCRLLKNMGFDYFLDQALITDYEIIADAARINKHSQKGFGQTIGSFCPSMTKSLIKMESTGAEQVADALLGSDAMFTTFVVTDCPARRSAATLFMGNPRSYSSVGITTDEFVKIIKEGGYDFKGTPCEMFPLGSAEGARAVTPERFANAVVGTFGHSFAGAHLPPIHFKDIDKDIAISTFEISQNYPVRVGSIKGNKALDRLYDMKLEDIIYISPRDCNKCYTPVDAIPSIDADSVKRRVELAMDNESAQNIWRYFMKLEDDEAFINRQTGYYD